MKKGKTELFLGAGKRIGELISLTSVPMSDHGDDPADILVSLALDCAKQVLIEGARRSGRVMHIALGLSDGSARPKVAKNGVPLKRQPPRRTWIIARGRIIKIHRKGIPSNMRTGFYFAGVFEVRFTFTKKPAISWIT